MAKSSTKAAWDPTGFLSMQDICLWETSFRRDQEYQSSHDGKTLQQGRREVEAQHLSVVDSDGDSFDLIRVIVTLGLRTVIPREPAVQDSEEFDVLHELTASFAVHYRIIRQPPESELMEFFKFNCVHNVWPFWRQHVYDTLKRASLPVVAIPFFSGRATKPLKAAP